MLNNFDQQSNSIIFEDFNAVLDPKMDRRDTNKPYHKKTTSKLLTEFTLENAIVDPWRASTPQTKKFSWANTRGTASRIDYALLAT